MVLIGAIFCMGAVFCGSPTKASETMAARRPGLVVVTIVTRDGATADSAAATVHAREKRCRVHPSWL